MPGWLPAASAGAGGVRSARTAPARITNLHFIWRICFLLYVSLPVGITCGGSPVSGMGEGDQTRRLSHHLTVCGVAWYHRSQITRKIVVQRGIFSRRVYEEAGPAFPRIGNRVCLNKTDMRG